MQYLIGLASSSGTGEECHNLPKEDGLWPACSHNRKLHISWKVHKAKFLVFVWAGKMFWFNSKQTLWPHCCIVLDIIFRTIRVSETFVGDTRKITSLNPKVLLMFVWEWKEQGPITWECFSEALGSQRDGYLDPFNFSLLLNPAPKFCWRLGMNWDDTEVW